MKISINTPIYNEKRYGKPYIGKVNPDDGKVTAWGTWIGTPGCKGILEIEVNPGDVIVKGQKDNRGNNGTPDYAVIQADGSREYMGKADAIRAARMFDAKPATSPMFAIKYVRPGEDVGPLGFNVQQMDEAAGREFVFQVLHAGSSILGLEKA